MWKLLTIILFLTIIKNNLSIKVCNELIDYYRPGDNNCYDNPDDETNVTSIVGRWGYKVDTYEITTEDGYILTLFKLNAEKKRSQAIFGHSLLSNCLIFVNRGNKSLAHIFLQNGYDVWLINFRGSRYSRKHATLTTESQKYWNFTFHQMAVYDLSTTINFVYEKTDSKSLYVGFSMGTVIGHVYMALNSEDASKYLLGAIHLAPVASLSYLPFHHKVFIPIYPSIEELINMKYNGEFIPSTRSVLQFRRTFTYMTFMIFWMVAFEGESLEQIDPTTVSVSTAMDLDASSFKMIMHYSQIIKSNRFQHFDYGPEDNMIYYGMKEPPVYDLSKVSIPVTFFVAKHDKFSPFSNAREIYIKFPKEYRCGFNVVPYDRFTHVDFVLAKDVKTLLYNNVIKAANGLINGVCPKNVIK